MATTASEKNTVDQIDYLIQQGEGKQAQRELVSFFQSEIPRPVAAQAAALAWRAGRPELGLKLLNPWVRPSSRKPNVASVEEKIEYAACLVKIGASHEAHLLLATLSPEDPSRQFLIRAFVHITHWNYHEAKQLLSRYVRAKDIRPYDRLVGKVNLVEALIHEQIYDKALTGLRDLLHDSSLKRLTFIQAKVLELAAQFWIERGKYSGAEKYLRQAEKLLAKTDGLDSFFVRKWTVFSSFLRTRGNAKSLAQWTEIRAEAVTRNHWESVRDCDRFRALTFKDESLGRRIYFGTPHASFRSNLLEEWGPSFEPGDRYLWQLGEKEASSVGLDLTETSPTLRDGIRPDSLLHRLLSTLTSDFYRPFRVAAIFARLYPEEFYSPTNSPPRVHVAVQRLRALFLELKISLQVLESDGSYRLFAPSPFAILMPAKDEEGKIGSHFLSTIRREWPSTPFSVKEVSIVLRCSPRTALSHVTAALGEGELSKEGKGRSTRYRLAS